MLGMMNCPTTENFDFYASSPTAMRQLNGSGSKLDNKNASSSDLSIEEGGLQKRSSSNALEVFSEYKRRPKYSYREDGRRLVDGKLESAHSEPEKLWNRLIVDSVTTKKLCPPQSSSSQNQLDGVENREESTEFDQPQQQGKQKRRFSFSSFFPLFGKKHSTGSRKVQQKSEGSEQTTKKSSSVSTSSDSAQSI